MQGHRKDPEMAEPDGNSAALVPAVSPQGTGPLARTMSQGLMLCKNAAFMQQTLGTGISGVRAPSPIYQHLRKTGLQPNVALM